MIPRAAASRRARRRPPIAAEGRAALPLGHRRTCTARSSGDKNLVGDGQGRMPVATRALWGASFAKTAAFGGRRAGRTSQPQPSSLTKTEVVASGCMFFGETYFWIASNRPKAARNAGRPPAPSPRRRQNRRSRFSSPRARGDRKCVSPKNMQPLARSGGAYGFTTTRSILKGVTPRTECGAPAGITML